MGKQSPKYQTIMQRHGLADPDLKTPGHDQILFWLKENMLEAVRGIVPTPRNSAPAALEGMREEIKAKIQRRLSELGERRRNEEALIADEKSTPNGARRVERDWAPTLREFDQEMARLAALPALGEPELPLAEVGRIYDERPISTGDRADIVVGFLDTVVDVKLPIEIQIGGGRKPDSYERARKFEDWSDPRWYVDVAGWQFGFEIKTSIPSYGELMRQVNLYRKYFRGIVAVVAPPTRFAAAIREQGVPVVEYPGTLPAGGPSQSSLFTA